MSKVDQLARMRLLVLGRLRLLSARSLVTGLMFAGFALCALVNLAQNVRELLSLPYVISPVLATPERVPLPSVYVCLSGYLNEQRLRQLHPHLERKLRARGLTVRTGRSQLSKWLNIGQLSQLSFTLNEVFTQCTVFDGAMRPVDCLRAEQVKEWLSLEVKCFQFFRPDRVDSARFRYRLDELASMMWIVIRLNRSMLSTENVGLLLASGRPDSPQPFLTNPAYALLPTAVLYTVTMAFRKIVTHRLAAPYESDCSDYGGPYVSQLNCTLACAAQLMGEGGPHWPSIVLTDQLGAGNRQHFCGSGKFRQHLRWCERNLCQRLDCHSEQYLLFSKYAKYSYHSQANFTIRLIYNYAPEQHVLYQPLFDLSELFSLVSFLFSPVSFWLGLAFLHIAVWTIACVRRNRLLVQKAFARLLKKQKKISATLGTKRS